jgi:hypothetical protein
LIPCLGKLHRADTHGVLQRPGVQVRSAGDDRGCRDRDSSSRAPLAKTRSWLLFLWTQSPRRATNLRRPIGPRRRTTLPSPVTRSDRRGGTTPMHRDHSSWSVIGGSTKTACARTATLHFCGDCRGCFFTLRVILFTDLNGVYFLKLDKPVGVVKFVLAYDVLSTLPNWDNLRLFDSEVLGEHLLDRLRMRLRHYRSSLRHRSLLTLKRSR